MMINGNFNTQSIINHRNTALNQLQSSFVKLSSGKAINQASDDIADFNKTTELDMRIRALDNITRNLEAEKDYVNFKEAALGNMNDAAQRMRELKVASENETLSELDLQAISQEFTELQETVEGIYEDSEFNTIKVFTNRYDGLKQESRDVIKQMTTPSSTIQDYSLDDMDQLLNVIGQERGILGARSFGIDAATSLYKTESLNLTGELSTRLDADMAHESMNLVQASLKEQVSMSMLIHAKLSNENVLALLK